MNICEENIKGQQVIAETERKIGGENVGRHAAAQDACIQRQIARRLANEARATINRRRINLLRKQIQSGAYQVNATAIAASMLLQSEC